MYMSISGTHTNCNLYIYKMSDNRFYTAVWSNSPCRKRPLRIHFFLCQRTQKIEPNKSYHECILVSKKYHLGLNAIYLLYISFYILFEITHKPAPNQISNEQPDIKPQTVFRFNILSIALKGTIKFDKYRIRTPHLILNQYIPSLIRRI